MSNQYTIIDYGDYIHPSDSTLDKELMVAQLINPSKYEHIGFVNRSTKAILRPRFHNVRDRKGRFARRPLGRKRF